MPQEASKRLFGTDGIRGTVNKYPMTPEIALKFGMAVGVYLRNGSHRHRVIIAKDTRLSGYLIEPALTAGFISVGIDVTLVGPMPTPAVPMLIKSLRADLGVMISASHNPYHDNGFKLFNKDGYKLSEKCEDTIQDLILNQELDQFLAVPDKLGRASRLDDAPGRYIEYVKNFFPKKSTLSGLKIVVDCANGAAYKLAPMILWELGAEVINIGCEPNGLNINEACGSMHPTTLAKKVLETRADIGIALDGDADRVVICDEKGKILHGDHIIGMIAWHLKAEEQLKGGVVITTMSNSALEKFLYKHGITVYCTNIGDKYVTDTMKQHGCNLGGEQSGHIILGEYSNTGDGIVAALQVLAILAISRKKISTFSQLFELSPQVLLNVYYSGDNPLLSTTVQKKLDAIRAENPDLRIMVRKSGTEKVLRVMVEGKQEPYTMTIAKKVEGILISE